MPSLVFRGFSFQVIAAAAVLTGCAGEQPPAAATIEQAWVRLPAAPGVAGAGYFSATLGAPGDAITSVASPSATRIELHEAVEADGVTRMVPLARAAHEGSAPIRFAPGGKHLMIFGLDPALRSGGEVALTFTFAQAPPATVRARLVSPGAGAPGHDGH